MCRLLLSPFHPVTFSDKLICSFLPGRIGVIDGYAFQPEVSMLQTFPVWGSGGNQEVVGEGRDEEQAPCREFGLYVLWWIWIFFSFLVLGRLPLGEAG